MSLMVEAGSDGDKKKTEHGRLERPTAEAFSLALARADRSRGSDNSPDRPPASAVRPEYAKMTLSELANAAAVNGNAAHGYAARVEMNRRIAQAQIDAAIA